MITNLRQRSLSICKIKSKSHQYQDSDEYTFNDDGISSSELNTNSNDSVESDEPPDLDHSPETHSNRINPSWENMKKGKKTFQYKHKKNVNRCEIKSFLKENGMTIINTTSSQDYCLSTYICVSSKKKSMRNKMSEKGI